MTPAPAVILERMALPARPEDITLSALIAEAALVGDPEHVLATLSGAQLETLGKMVLADELKDTLRRKIQAARIDITAERTAWLACYESRATRDTYGRALDILTEWTELKGLDIATLTPAQADEWIQYETGRDREKADADTVRLRAAAVSSFYTFMERRHPDTVRNPVRGSRARPKRSTPRAIVPTPAEVRTIAAAARARGDLDLYAAVLVMFTAGLRVGGLSELTIRADGSYTTTSKGKAVLGMIPLPPRVLAAVRVLGPRPFAGYPGRRIDALKARFAYLVAGLVQAGRVAAPYSPHDLRHAFAEVHKDRGLYWLKDALGHASVSVTETYLRNTLGIDPRSIEDRQE